MNQAVLDNLNQFNPITLQEMDGVKLMDRTDTKFTFNINMLPVILGEAKEYYRILEVEGNRISRYKTLYFDTEDFDLYNNHNKCDLVKTHLKFLIILYQLKIITNNDIYFIYI